MELKRSTTSLPQKRYILLSHGSSKAVEHSLYLFPDPSYVSHRSHLVWILGNNTDPQILRSWTLLPCFPSCIVRVNFMLTPTPAGPRMRIRTTSTTTTRPRQRTKQEGKRKFPLKYFGDLAPLARVPTSLQQSRAFLTLHMTNEGVVSRDLFFALPSTLQLPPSPPPSMLDTS